MTEITILNECIKRFEALLVQSNLSQKNALTLEEAAVYTGRTPSNLYKLTSSRAIPHSKPEGKMVYFDRLELEKWMLRNPIRTQASIDAEAANYVAAKRGRKGGW